MTYSIVARDPDTGQLGAALQSCYFAAASQTLWAEPGVGVITSQAFSEPMYGVIGLQLLGAGRSAPEVLGELVELDKSPELRQVAIVDSAGRSAAHTGESCVPEASHVTADGFSVQANMMQNSTVPSAMASAYQQADGDLGARLLVALAAAQAAGGDFRGQQSSGAIVVEGRRRERSWEGRILDVRVDDSGEPLAELQRLVVLARGYRSLHSAIERLGDLDLAGAADAAGSAASVLPTVIDPTLIQVALLATEGRLDEARAVIEGFAGEPGRLSTAIRRYTTAKVLPLDDATLEALLSGAQ